MSAVAVDRTDEFRALVDQACRRHRRLPPAASTNSAQQALLAHRHRNMQRALDALDGSCAHLPPPQALRVALAECTLARDNATNDQQRRHWCEVERLLQQRHCTIALPTTTTTPDQVAAMTDIERRLYVVSTLYSTVNELVSRQSRPIGDIEQNIGAIEARMDASHDYLFDAAPRAYRTQQWRWYRQYVPQSLPARLRAGLALLFCINLLVVGCLLS
jgi:hypothetical protein